MTSTTIETKLKMKKKPGLVSIIIPTYNRSNDVCRLIDSIIDNEYDNYEIIVVDNCSEDDTICKIECYAERHSNIKLIKLEHNMMAAGGRNAGIDNASGDYLLFIDSDNVIEPKMIGKLVCEMRHNSQIGLIGPLMLYYKDKNLIWFSGCDINKFTSRTKYFNANKRLVNINLERVLKTHHVPNCMMTTKEVVEKIGGFDPIYFIMYEEADFAERIKNAGYEVIVLTEAVTFHDVMLPSETDGVGMRKYGCDNALRTYHFSKNRNIFINRYSNIIGKIVYFGFFRVLFAAYYCFLAIKNNRTDIAKAWIRGSLYKE